MRKHFPAGLPWTALALLLAACASNSSAPPRGARADGEVFTQHGDLLERWQPYHFNPEIEEVQKIFDAAMAFYAMGDIDSTRISLAMADSLLDVLIAEETIEHNRREMESLSEELGEIRDLLAIEEDFDSFVDSVGIDYDEISVQTTPDHQNPPWPYDIDIVHNSRTEAWIQYFTTRGRARFQVWLDRSVEYEPIVLEILKEQGLPSDLQHLPLIESGYNPRARSRAKAVGLWQFIAGTGRKYGLRVDWWVDERRDVVASTWAATHFLEFLYRKFESWPLALAAYNCGEYRVARAMRRQGTRDLWVLRLPRQTRNYVPKFMAATIIAHDPEAYGFKRRSAPAFEYDIVQISHPVDLSVIARRAALDKRILKKLNPALLREVTPPNYKDFELKVPPGTREVCERELANIPPAERVNWVRHKIRRGETLSGIAGYYDTSVRAIMSLNSLRSAHRIRAGTTILVPSPRPSTSPSYTARYRQAPSQNVVKATTDPLPGETPPPGHKAVVYRVKKGDTLGHIAEFYHTRASKIRRWNRLSYRSYIYPGQKLRIFVPASFEEADVATDVTAPSLETHRKITYRVKRGDTLYGIGKKYKTSVDLLLRWNHRSVRQTLYPGEVLTIWLPRPKS